MVDGTHFRLGHARTPATSGYRALAGALSDLAAMGADAGEAYRRVVPAATRSATTTSLALHRGAEALAARDRRRRSPAATSRAARR